MENQKIINLLQNTSNQPCKFGTKNWVELNDESRGVCNIGSQIKFKTSTLTPSLCDYGDAYILVKELFQSYRKRETTQIITIMK